MINQNLLQLIIDNKHKLLKELKELTDRDKSNLSRTLKILEKYGIVELHKKNRNVIPEVRATQCKQLIINDCKTNIIRYY